MIISKKTGFSKKQKASARQQADIFAEQQGCINAAAKGHSDMYFYLVGEVVKKSDAINGIVFWCRNKYPEKFGINQQKKPVKKTAAKINNSVYSKQIPQALNTELRIYNHPLLGKHEYVEFYTSTAWRQLRYLALKNAAASCQCCGTPALPGKPLHVDHIKPRSRYPELELSLDNLQVLCQDCNIGKGAWDDTDWRQSKVA